MIKKIDFSTYSSIKIGGIVDVLVVESCNDVEKDRYIIGGCNNLLLSNNPPPLMMLSKKYDYIKVQDDMFIVGGATLSGKVVSFCKKHNIGGFEFLSQLPGKMGGIVKMNAGMKQDEIFDNLIYVSACKGKLKKQDIEFGYRFANIDGVIFEVGFRFDSGFDAKKVSEFKKMRTNQPKKPSAGSCFKNPPNDYAGRLIEAVGLKGYRVGNMCFSNLHANFLVNLGGGIYDDAKTLIDEAKKRVYEKFNIVLEEEVVIL